MSETRSSSEMNERTHAGMHPVHPWPCRCRLAREMARVGRQLPGWGVLELVGDQTWKAIVSNGADHEHGRDDSMLAALHKAVERALEAAELP